MVANSVFPDIKLSSEYFDDWLKTLQDFRKATSPELSDFNENEPLVQLERAMAAIAHLMMVHLDQNGIENFLPTMRLRQSFINLGQMLDFKLALANPAVATILAKLSQVLTATTTLITEFDDFSTSGLVTEIIFESLVDVTTTRTDLLSQAEEDDGGIFTDRTTDSNNGATYAPWGGSPQLDDALYFGHDEIIWNRVDFTLTVAGSGLSVVWEYFDETLKAWAAVPNLVDGTSDLSASGAVNFTLPFDGTKKWGKTTIDGKNQYWMRARITVSAGTSPTIDRIRIDLGNQYRVFPVTQGERVTDIPLGSSDGLANQKFTLSQKPILEGSLTVEVDEGGGFVAWTKQANFLDSKATDTHYTIDTFFDGTVTVRFGDGTNGKIPASGTDNVQAKYRIGGTTDGNVGANTIISNKAGRALLASITNPQVASGWSPVDGLKESDRNLLRQRIPASLRTRNRGVSIPDVVFLTESWTDPVGGGQPVGRAKAVADGAGPNVIQIVVEAVGGGVLTTAQKTNLDSFFNDVNTGVIVLGQQVQTIDYTPRSFVINATVTGGNSAVILAALLALFDPEKTNPDGTFIWSFGETIPLSQIICEIQAQANVTGVVLNNPTLPVQLGVNELPKLVSTDVTLTIL